MHYRLHAAAAAIMALPWMGCAVPPPDSDEVQVTEEDHGALAAYPVALL
jgi:hypothetical protein